MVLSVVTGKSINQYLLFLGGNQTLFSVARAGKLVRLASLINRHSVSQFLWHLLFFTFYRKSNMAEKGTQSTGVSPAIAELLLLGAAMMWGVNFVVVKAALSQFQPHVFTERAHV